MAKKDFLLELGERSGNPEDTDVLLKSKISERKRKEITRQEEEDEAAHKAKMAELKKKEKSADAEGEKAERKTDVPEPPFKVTGGVNLGNIDLQKDREEARAELERLKKEADDAARATGQENQQLRDKIHEQEIKMLQITFQAQMDVLTKLIESGASKKTFIEQYNEAMEISKALGLAQPSAQSADLQATLSIKKLEFEQGLALRQFAREEKRADREFQRQLGKDADEREAKKADQTRQAKRDEMFIGAPEVVGRAIAQGLMASKEGSGGMSAPTRGKQRYELEVPIGKEGVTECPECQTQVGIGPTAKSALCSKCNTKIFIKRVEAPTTEPIEEEEE